MSSILSIGRQANHLDPVDTAALLYDKLQAHEPSRVQLESWSAGGGAIERATEQRVLEGALTLERVEQTAQTPMGAFYVLRGIDRACAVLDPARAAPRDRGALAGSWWRWLHSGRLDTGAHPGAVLPRRSAPGRPLGVPDDLDGYLSNIIRVREEDFCGRRGRGVTFERCPALHDVDPTDRGQLAMGAVAFVGDLTELRCARVTGTQGRDWYSITLNSSMNWPDRARRVLASLDEAGVQVALLPELALTQTLLEQWQALVRTTRRPPTSRLTWIMLGTGPTTTDAEVPPNRAVIIHRVTGDVVLAQDKCHPFTLATGHLVKWGLREELGDGPLAEYMTEGRQYHLLESSVGRVCVFVCEDLGRVAESAPEVLPFGLTHLLVPIFAEPIRRHHWEESSADMLANQVGCGTAVINSIAVKVPARAGVVVGDALFLHTKERWQTEEWDNVVKLLNAGGDPERVMMYDLPTA